jgi:hypothetical protein
LVPFEFMSVYGVRQGSTSFFTCGYPVFSQETLKSQVQAVPQKLCSGVLTLVTHSYPDSHGLTTS